MFMVLTDGDKNFITIHDECPEELADFVLGSVIDFISSEEYNEIRRCEVLENDL